MRVAGRLTCLRSRELLSPFVGGLPGPAEAIDSTAIFLLGWDYCALDRVVPDTEIPRLVVELCEVSPAVASA